MSRCRGPRVKIIRRLGALLGLTSKILKLKSSYIDRSTSNKKISQYHIWLEEKQKLRFQYGVTERQLLKYVHIARKAKGSMGQVLLQLLAMRLDNTICCLGMASTILGARQLVNHRHISINNEIVNIPSYDCELGDIITIRNSKQSQSRITTNMSLFHKSEIPNHLTFDSTQFRGLINKTIHREWVDLKVNELLVIEYYSHQV